MGTSGGFQVFGGRYFGCGRYALMGTFWGLYPSDESVMILDPAGGVGVGDYLRTDLPLTIQNPAGDNEHGIEMPGVGGPVLGPDGGRTGYDWMTNSFAQRLVRSQDFNNVELSLFSFGLGGAARNGLARTGCGGGHGMVSAGRMGTMDEPVIAMADAVVVDAVADAAIVEVATLANPVPSLAPGRPVLAVL